MSNEGWRWCSGQARWRCGRGSLAVELVEGDLLAGEDILNVAPALEGGECIEVDEEEVAACDGIRTGDEVEGAIIEAVGIEPETKGALLERICVLVLGKGALENSITIRGLGLHLEVQGEETLIFRSERVMAEAGDDGGGIRRGEVTEAGEEGECLEAGFPGV